MQSRYRVVYACQMRDGGHRVVEAVSWLDCRRFLGSTALTILRTTIDPGEHVDHMFDEAWKAEVFLRALSERKRMPNMARRTLREPVAADISLSGGR